MIELTLIDRLMAFYNKCYKSIDDCLNKREAVEDFGDVEYEIQKLEHNIQAQSDTANNAEGPQKEQLKQNIVI